VSNRYERACRQANVYKALVARRTGLKGSALVCPREKSAMTPCVARDGQLAVCHPGLCVGCEADVGQLLRAEEAKHAPG
jgi:hypothetical protein